MTDTEKVIYDIERCICRVPDACRDCSHYQDDRLDCIEKLLADALALLKERDSVKPKQVDLYGKDEWCPLKEQNAVVRQWTKEIADNQLAHAPKDSHEFMSLDEHLENEYKRGIWDGLQIAWNIISEGR